MSTLKFRAWDKERKEWIVGCDLIMDSDGRVFAGDVGNLPMVEIDSYFVNFALGIKDSEGNEVYEGDILKPIMYGTILGGKVYEGFDGYYKKYCVDDVRNVSADLRQDAKKMKIVGHIYEA